MMEDIYKDSKNMEEELPAEALRFEKDDINDIKILKYIHSLKQRKIQYCIFSFVVSDMESKISHFKSVRFV